MNGIPEASTKMRTGNFCIGNWLMWASVHFYSFNLEQGQWSSLLEFSNVRLVNTYRARSEHVTEVQCITERTFLTSPSPTPRLPPLFCTSLVRGDHHTDDFQHRPLQMNALVNITSAAPRRSPSSSFGTVSTSCRNKTAFLTTVVPA